jgi:hypothetical protein
MTDSTYIPSDDPAALTEATTAAVRASLRLGALMVSMLTPEAQAQVAALLDAGGMVGTLIATSSRVGSLPTAHLVTVNHDGSWHSLAHTADGWAGCAVTLQ